MNISANTVKIRRKGHTALLFFAWNCFGKECTSLDLQQRDS